MSKLGQIRPVASRHKQRSQLHSSQELLHLCRWSRVSLQAVVFFVSRPPLCFRYHLFVSNTISLFQIPSLCFNTISLFQIPPLCFRYHLFDKKTLNAQEFKEAVEKITKLKISGSDSDTNSRNNHSWDSQNWPFGLEMAAWKAVFKFCFC